jgi:chlorite dismutase
MAEQAHPPETAEGWYALHQVFSIDRRALRRVERDDLEAMKTSAMRSLDRLVGTPSTGTSEQPGWSALVSLVGSDGDVMFIHFRESLDALGEAQGALSAEPLFDFLIAKYSFLSVTEAGFYHITADAAREAATTGGTVGDAAYRARVAGRVQAEIGSAHVKQRLYPSRPPEMPYVCFYPMSKRREPDQNWYALTLAERSRLMIAHGLVGRQYAGKIVQIIAGAIGLSAWEWGVTLFARDPLEFKRILTEMRFDEVSANYAEFGDFYVGRITTPERWVGGLLAGTAVPAGA